MIAEDGEVNMLLAKTIVKSIAPNSIIVEAKNGLLAVQACVEKMPDIILMDIQMPEMNGYEATKKIRALQTNVHVPIIAVTAGNVKGEKEKCMNAGMDDFIAKPIIENTVKATFHKWVPNVLAAHTDTDNKDTGKPDNNFQVLRELVGNDPVMYKELLELAKKDIKASVTDLGEKTAAKDWPAVKKAGHKLKGTALSFGLQKLSVLATKFERLDNFDAATLDSLLQQARAETETVLHLIDQNMPV